MFDDGLVRGCEGLVLFLWFRRVLKVYVILEFRWVGRAFC